MRRLTLAALLWAAGCGGTNGSSGTTSTPPGTTADLAPTADAGSPVGHDAGTGAGADGGAAPDAGTAPPADGSPPPTADLGAPPTGSDAGPPPTDGGLPPGDDGGSGGATCGLTAPQAIVSSAKFAGALQVDDEWIYYIDEGPTALWRVPKDGSAAPTSLVYLGTVNDDVWAWDYAVDASRIYVMQYGKSDMTLTAGGVSIYDKDMNLQRHVDATSPSGSCYTPILLQLAVAAGNVYWVQAEGFRDTSCPAVDQHVVRLGPNDTSGTVIGSTAGVNDLVATADSVYVSSSTEGVFRLPAAGGSAQTLTNDAPLTIVSDGSAAYWNDSANGIYRGTSGGATLIAGPLFDELDADDGHALYGIKGSGASAVAGRIANDGSGYTSVTSGTSVAVDDLYVYYTDANRVKVYRACK